MLPCSLTPPAPILDSVMSCHHIALALCWVISQCLILHCCVMLYSGLDSVREMCYRIQMLLILCEQITNCSRVWPHTVS